METNTLTCRAINVDHIAIADLPEQSNYTITIDIACTLSAITPVITPRTMINRTIAQAHQYSGLSLAELTQRIAYGLLDDMQADEITVSIHVPLAFELLAQTISWTCTVHQEPTSVENDGNSDQASEHEQDTVSVEPVSHYAVVALESKIPHAEQLFRKIIVTLDGIPGNQIEGISPLYMESRTDGGAIHTAVIGLYTTMSTDQLTRTLQSLQEVHEGAVVLQVITMATMRDEEQQAVAQRIRTRAAILAPWLDMDPQASLAGDPLAFLLATAPDSAFVGMESDHWIIGSEQ